MRMDFDLSDTEFQNKRRFDHEATELTEGINPKSKIENPKCFFSVTSCSNSCLPWLGETSAEVCPVLTAEAAMVHVLAPKDQARLALAVPLGRDCRRQARTELGRSASAAFGSPLLPLSAI